MIGWEAFSRSLPLNQRCQKGTILFPQVNFGFALTIEMAEDDGVRLLVFDGGDIRTISQLHILREFMNRVGYMRQLDKPPLPCQYFHLIGGTGTGGLIALLLAVFQMSIEEAEERFAHIWRFAFQYPANLSNEPTSPPEYLSRNSTRLQSIIRVFLGESGRRKDLQLIGSTDESFAKCFVCASPTASTGEYQSFRTFESPGHTISSHGSRGYLCLLCPSGVV